MASADLGVRDARGEWKPTERIEFPPPFQWPPRPLAFLKWMFGFPGYLWPLNAFWFGTTALTWFVLTPPLESMATFRPGWMALILARNAALCSCGSASGTCGCTSSGRRGCATSSATAG